ncbi:hypothetical protein [Qipengyuania spongiae]|uniref:Helix-turn-helix domain-containing protein n=1 Tax=Qipengyuania spongiae TaxID=2909673 RepID=A0ABY5SWL9_9SPHN|nr:hypothetical protein [Qipengyuania spongiae]UVI38609.1 hypothetical protein L1F33_10145 [Qipengyuania spongiae]
MNAPTPNLPALLEQLPDGDTRKPLLELTPAVMREFLEALAVVGSVRSAARVARVSHQTVYRARRALPEFRRCWDAALLQALPHAEDALATRAIDGVEEKVFYHGEEIGTRRRHDPRLLLAHIGRLDRLAARSDVAHLSDRFDEALDALEKGEPLPCAAGEEAGADAGGNVSSEPCNTRSMSNSASDSGSNSDGAGEPVVKDWYTRMIEAMEDDRPFYALLPSEHDDPELVDEVQFFAFEEGLDRWWEITTYEELNEAREREAILEETRQALAGGGGGRV